jgi:hypothetical protein
LEKLKRKLESEAIQTVFDDINLESNFGCGNWQENYKKLHDDIMNGKQATKQLIVVSVEAGLADRLTGLITGFYFSVLTGRAIRMVSYDLLPPFENAFDSPYVNWTVPSNEFSNEVLEPLKFTYKGKRGYTGDRSYGSAVDTKKYWPMYMINEENVARSVYVDSDITTQPTGKTDVPYIFLASNRGKVYELFTESSEANKKLVKNLNIKKNENGFLCGFFFLFRPNIFVKEYYSKFWARILEDRNAVVIGKCKY